MEKLCCIIKCIFQLMTERGLREANYHVVCKGSIRNWCVKRRRKSHDGREKTERIKTMESPTKTPPFASPSSSQILFILRYATRLQPIKILHKCNINGEKEARETRF